MRIKICSVFNDNPIWLMSKLDHKALINLPGELLNHVDNDFRIESQRVIRRSNNSVSKTCYISLQSGIDILLTESIFEGCLDRLYCIVNPKGDFHPGEIYEGSKAEIWLSQDIILFHSPIAEMLPWAKVHLP